MGLFDIDDDQLRELAGEHDWRTEVPTLASSSAAYAREAADVMRCGCPGDQFV